jgi:hypothetical protein
MYNGQFVKGMVHLAIFAVLVSASHVFGIFGLFVMGWIFYQMFDAYNTAKARRDGDPLPDPLGLNEVSSWFVTGGRAVAGSAAAGPAAGNGNGGRGSGGKSGALSIRLPGSVSVHLSGAVFGASAGTHGAGLPADATHPAYSALSADACGVLAAPGTGRRSDSDCPGRAVSAGTISMVFLACVPVLLAAAADRVGGVADGAATARLAGRATGRAAEWVAG